MTNNTAAHAAAIALAGADFKWTNANAPKSKRSDEIAGITDILANDIQGGLCVACGDVLDGAIQLCHIVASRKSGFGIMAGNVYAGHVGCNDDDYKVFGDIVPLDSLVRADLIADSLPTRQASLARYAELQARREARRARRVAR